MAASKNKKKKSKKGQTNLRLAHFLHEHLWKICLAIAIFDLAHALFFVLQATISLVTRFNMFSTLALLGTIFWVLMVVLFLVGLWKRRPVFVKAWLIFSIIGFLADIGFLIWGIVSSVTIDWDNLKEFTIIFVGIFIEITCIYVVYRYYLVMDPCRLVDEPERGRKKKSRKPLDKKACKESKKKEKKKKKPEKKNKR
ncbi:uncharacterized protein LOC115770385 [Drosophila novamexicana]|uniref:uncharacterized protein LOC115770385 n=1 Tax=Drosophila novamexicana TaxID=47314 RepID=UPI0011E5E2CE|nr:uncharacterized protein LOC115770385 [Drosophila novamexicana]